MLRTLLAAAAAVAIASPAAAQLVVSPETIGQIVVVNSADDVIATYVGADAGFTSELYLDSPFISSLIFSNGSSTPGETFNLGSFAIGTELIFRLYVTNEDDNFFTGPASRNPDNAPHAAVNTVAGVTYVGFEDFFGAGNGDDFNDLIFSFTNTEAAPGAVPEPATWALMIGGFGAAGAVLRRRRALA